MSDDEICEICRRCDLPIVREERPKYSKSKSSKEKIETKETGASITSGIVMNAVSKGAVDLSYPSIFSNMFRTIIFLRTG